MAVTQTEHALLSKHGYRRKSDREYVREGHTVNLSGHGDWSHSGGQHSAGGLAGNSGRGLQSLEAHLAKVHGSQHSEEPTHESESNMNVDRANEIAAATTRGHQLRKFEHLG